jgi:cell division protein FtsN
MPAPTHQTTPAKAEKKVHSKTPAAKAPPTVAEKLPAKVPAKAPEKESIQATKKVADKASAKLRKKMAAPPVAAPKTPPANANANASASASSADSDLPVVGSAAGHYLNVGVFAEVGNARRAQAKLLNVGLPAFRQTVSGPKGEYIRVRVGPYNSAAEAQKATQQIRRMGLEAVPFQQRAR